MASAIREYGDEALPAGAGSGEIKELADWADRVIVVEEALMDALPDTIKQRAELIELGPDRWGDPANPELLGICRQLLLDKGLVKGSGK